MSKKPNTAAALAGILQAKRGDDSTAAPAPPAVAEILAEAPSPPSPAPLPEPVSEAPAPLPAAKKPRGGKSSDKATYSQFSVYLRKDTRKKVGRVLDDADTGQDFSELVQELLEHWLASRT